METTGMVGVAGNRQDHKKWVGITEDKGDSREAERYKLFFPSSRSTW